MRHFMPFYSNSRKDNSMIKVMFICHGNICRSPMAEFIMKDMVKKMGIAEQFDIVSSATSNEEIGHSVYPPARQELAKHGIDCTGKYAVRMKKSDYDYYDYILCMDSRNIRNAEKITGKTSGGKMVKLLWLTGSSDDIADPWYYGNFDKTYDDIVKGCNAFIQYLKSNQLITD